MTRQTKLMIGALVFGCLLALATGCEDKDNAPRLYEVISEDAGDKTKHMEVFEDDGGSCTKVSYYYWDVVVTKQDTVSGQIVVETERRQSDYETKQVNCT